MSKNNKAPWQGTPKNAYTLKFLRPPPVQQRNVHLYVTGVHQRQHLMAFCK